MNVIQAMEDVQIFAQTPQETSAVLVMQVTDC